MACLGEIPTNRNRRETATLGACKDNLYWSNPLVTGKRT
jgi:hypothetical protein